MGIEKMAGKLEADLRLFISRVGNGAVVEGLEGIRAIAVRDAPIFTAALVELDDAERNFLPAVDWADIATAPTVGIALNILAGSIWAISGRENDALEIYLASKRAGLDDSLAQLGEALAWLGRESEAIDELSEVVENRSSGWQRAAGVLGALLFHRDPSAVHEPIRLLLLAGNEVSEDDELDLSKALVSDGRIDDARVRLERHMSLGSVRAPILLGNLLLDHFDDFAGAEAAYRIGISRGDAFSAYNLALLLSKSDRQPEAAALLKYASDRGDESATTALSLRPTPWYRHDG